MADRLLVLNHSLACLLWKSKTRMLKIEDRYPYHFS